MHSLIRGVERLEPPLQRRIFEGLSEGLLKDVQAATAVAWLPIALNVELADTIARSLGPERARPFFRDMLLAEYQSSLFRPFIEGISRLFGVGPSVFVKMAPRGWELVYRACGTLTPMDVGPGEARLVLSELPEACVRNALWLDAVRSTFYTAFDLPKIEGEIAWKELSLSSRRAVMRSRWDA